ncbi:MAG TPA: hypothetical protein ENI11_00215 [Actinobacteria bacterium]|nr:hypothetical protein [Actinomycetota bacterium]
MLKIFEKYLVGIGRKEHILNTFAKLGEIPETRGPKFVFAHMITPHPPYLFDESGKSVPETELKMSGDVWTKRELYIDQLIFINKKVKLLVDEILSKSEIPPIIVLQADHGSASILDGKSGWENPSSDGIKERMRILNAYYLPEGGDRLVYDSITPVNTFRAILNHYFKTNYELLGDKSYFSTYERPYDFSNVTKQALFN